MLRNHVFKVVKLNPSAPNLAFVWELFLEASKTIDLENNVKFSVERLSAARVCTMFGHVVSPKPSGTGPQPNSKVHGHLKLEGETLIQSYSKPLSCLFKSSLSSCQQWQKVLNTSGCKFLLTHHVIDFNLSTIFSSPLQIHCIHML